MTNDVTSLPENEGNGFSSPRTQKENSSVPFSEPLELSRDEETAFEELLNIGKKTTTDTVFGHQVYLSTLTVEEELLVALLIKPYIGSDGYQRAYKAAVVAASVKEIDGQPVYQALSRDEDDSFVINKKFQKVTSYYPVVVDQMYQKVIELESGLRSLLEEKLGKTFG